MIFAVIDFLIHGKDVLDAVHGLQKGGRILECSQSLLLFGFIGKDGLFISYAEGDAVQLSQIGIHRGVGWPLGEDGCFLLIEKFRHSIKLSGADAGLQLRIVLRCRRKRGGLKGGIQLRRKDVAAAIEKGIFQIIADRRIRSSDLGKSRQQRREGQIDPDGDLFHDFVQQVLLCLQKGVILEFIQIQDGDKPTLRIGLGHVDHGLIQVLLQDILGLDGDVFALLRFQRIEHIVIKGNDYDEKMRRGEGALTHGQALADVLLIDLAAVKQIHHGLIQEQILILVNRMLHIIHLIFQIDECVLYGSQDMGIIIFPGHLLPEGVQRMIDAGSDAVNDEKGERDGSQDGKSHDLERGHAFLCQLIPGDSGYINPSGIGRFREGQAVFGLLRTQGSMILRQRITDIIQKYIRVCTGIGQYGKQKLMVRIVNHQTSAYGIALQDLCQKCGGIDGNGDESLSVGQRRVQRNGAEKDHGIGRRKWGKDQFFRRFSQLFVHMKRYPALERCGGIRVMGDAVIRTDGKILPVLIDGDGIDERISGQECIQIGQITGIFQQSRLCAGKKGVQRKTVG